MGSPKKASSTSEPVHSDGFLLARMENLTRRQYKYLDDKYIARTQRLMPDKFQEMCHMHLAFLLDLSGDKLELLLSSSDDLQRKRRLALGSAAAAVFKKKEKPPVGLFGAPLTDEGVCLMLPLISFLSEEKNICKEGLFRKPGNRNRMNSMRESLNVHGTAASLDPEVYSPHDVAGVLKEFLRELPEPVLTDKHMEAHRQILEMGKHASTEEMRAHYNQKKLSALQLLTILLPSAARIIVLRVLLLLQKVARCPETRMTPTTLGTIFAPIFFLSRKVDASEMCTAISQCEPALAFMIEHASELYKAPNQLIIDLSKVWNHGEGGSPLSSIDSNSNTTLKKSISGQTLNTNICYTDREASRCDDVASNTQAELNNLYAAVQNLPDTPHFRKIKQNVLKGTTTPTMSSSSNKKHHRSKSIGASIRKRLPSLGRSKNKREMSTYSACSKTPTSSTKSKTSTPAAMSDLLQSPAVNSAAMTKALARQSRPRHKRQLSVDALNGDTVGDCTSPKQEFRPAGEVAAAAASTLASPSSSSSSSDCLSPVSPKDAFIAPTPVDDATCSYICMTPSEDESSRDSSVASFPTNASSSSCTNGQSVKEYSSSVTASSSSDCAADQSSELALKDIKVVGKLCAAKVAAAHPEPELPSATPNSKVFQMKEIDFMSQGQDQLIQRWMAEENKPALKVHPRPCNAPGTPVMPRSMLRLAQFDALETSI